MPVFEETQMDPSYTLEAVGGPQFKTTILSTKGGLEQRNIDWSKARGLWTLDFLHRPVDEIAPFQAFFYAVFGDAIGFRFKDWSDYKSTLLMGDTITDGDQGIGTGDGITADFQLTKTYAFGSLTYVRIINKPVPGTVVVAVDAVPAGITVDTTTGIISITDSPGPDAGQTVTAGFEFDVAARLDTDHMKVKMHEPTVMSWTGLQIKELKAVV